MLHNSKLHVALKVLTVFYLSKRDGTIFGFSKRGLSVGTTSNMSKMSPIGNEQREKLDITFNFHISSWNMLLFFFQLSLGAA